jgi:hypothetical protein
MSDVSWVLRHGLWSLVSLGGLPGSSPFQVVVLGPVQQQLAGPRGVSLPCSRRRALSLKATRLVWPIRASEQTRSLGYSRELESENAIWWCRLRRM